MGWAEYILAGSAILAVVALYLLWRPVMRARRLAEFERARKQFHRQREWLEVRFLSTAAASGRPRGLRWTECEFDDAVTYARNRQTGELCAFAAVTIGFEAIEGGLMEGVEAVGNLRAATAVFRYHKGAWHTDGRAIFNLNPTEAIAYYQENLVLVGHETTSKSSV